MNSFHFKTGLFISALAFAAIGCSSSGSTGGGGNSDSGAGGGAATGGGSGTGGSATGGGTGTGGSTSGSSDCDAFCTSDISTCSGANAAYASKDVCMAACAKFPTTGKAGDASGDTLQCRQTHLGLAGSALALHCPHTGATSDVCK